MRYLIVFFTVIFLYGFVNFIRSIYYRCKLADKMVRVVPQEKRHVSYICIMAAAVYIFVCRVYGYGAHSKAGDTVRAENDMCLMIIAGLSFVYFMLVLLNSKYVYVTDKMILFPDCARRSADYRYRLLSGDTLEFRPVKPPKKPEIYIIGENKELLEEILAENYQPIEA